MRDFHKIWIDQCEAAEGIREDHGLDKAFGYLIGEKFLNFLQAAEDRSEFEGEVPEFAARIRELFQPWEIRVYLESVRRVGALGHTCTDEQYETLAAAGAVEEDVVRAAKEVILLDQAREWLLPD